MAQHPRGTDLVKALRDGEKYGKRTSLNQVRDRIESRNGDLAEGAGRFPQHEDQQFGRPRHFFAYRFTRATIRHSLARAAGAPEPNPGGEPDVVLKRVALPD